MKKRVRIDMCRTDPIKLRQKRLPLIFSFTFICLFTPLAALAQTPSGPLISACDLIKNAKKYHKKVLSIAAIMDAHVEGSAFWPTRDCSSSKAIAFTTDEDFKEINEPAIRDEFWAALEPVAAIEKEHPNERFSMRYCCVLRTPITVKGYFIASDKPEFGRFEGHKLIIHIRQILDIGEPRLIEVGNKDYFLR